MTVTPNPPTENTKVESELIANFVSATPSKARPSIEEVEKVLTKFDKAFQLLKKVLSSPPVASRSTGKQAQQLFSPTLLLCGKLFAG